MNAWFGLLAAGVALGSTTSPEGREPPPVPSGMDLLYSNRVVFKPGGEPVITLGLMTGQKQIVIRSATPLRADFFESGTLKQTTVRAGDPVQIGMIRAQPAKRQFFVDVEGVAWGEPELLDATLSGWRHRGFPEAQALEQGTVLGIGGRVIDNREYRISLPVTSARQAQRTVSELYAKFGTRAFVSARLAERPWGELRVKCAGAPIGRATSFVRFVTPGSLIEVKAVEHGKGYAWHGFQDRHFRGEIYVAVDPDGQLAVVNVLGAEDVLAGVVPSELFASAHPEALKAQAVAARNQLFAKLGKRHHDDPFHLCAEQHCQVYGGAGKEDPRTTAAVNATAGQVAFRNGRLVDTVYSSSCGGFTENNDVVWGNAPDPALRARPDFAPDAFPKAAEYQNGIPPDKIATWLKMRPRTYCSMASKARPEKFRWHRKFFATELQSLLANKYGWIGKLRAIRVTERGVGGRVVTLSIEGSQGVATILHELPIRRTFRNLNSGTFVVDSDHDAHGQLTAVTFVGGGWGHGVGMCQLGALGRAEAGQNYHQILAHYYNGAAVAVLYKVTQSRR